MGGTPELESWLLLGRADGIGPVAVSRLQERYGTPSAALAAGARAWRGLGLTEAQCAALAAPDRDGAARDLRWLEGAQRHCLTLADPRYPPQLREIPQPPLLLFCQGDPELLRLPQIAIVGARAASPQGLDNARAFGAELARRGLVVTSGLALGIDGAAHRGALEAEGLTIAVCGTGLDRVYPARHRALAHDIGAHGLLVSEFPTGVPAVAENFPRRNRIISGLALGVLVVEAARESGSLITARMAGEQGRELFAIPGSIHNPMARGCHALIREGAKLVETADDVLQELGPQIAAQRRSAPASASSAAAAAAAATAAPVGAALAPFEVSLLERLGDAPRHVDALTAELQAPVERVQAALLRLELEGHVAPVDGGSYQRRHGAA